MKANGNVLWWCVGAVSIVVSLSCIIWLGHDWFIQARDNHHDTSEHKLLDCTNSTLSVHFVMPPAKAFMLLLGYPPGSKSTFTNAFSGQVEIRQWGTNLVAFSIESDVVQECNWLTHRGMGDAYVLNWVSTKPNLAMHLKAGKIYEFRVQFTQAPPTNTSLWASFIQRHGDVHRNSSIVVASGKP